jgi:hypothetical protein
MTSENVALLFLVFIIAVLLVAIGYLAWEARRKKVHLAAVRADWTTHQRTVHFGPVIAEYYGSEPCQTYRTGPISGALGLVDQHLVFVGRTGGEEWIPFDQIRWIGARSVMVPYGDGYARADALIVHYEERGIWYVGAWVSEWRQALGKALGEETGLPVHSYGSEREDYGPARAACLIQDVYGRWHPFSDGARLPDADGISAERLDADQGELYLAPDRLLFNRRHSIHLAQVRRADVFEPGVPLAELNPFHEDLLRIEYESPEQQHAVIGFLVRGGGGWASAIRTRTSVPYEHHRGRKKKES